LKVTFDDLSLILDVSWEGRKISFSTPQWAFLEGYHFYDLQCELYSIRECCKFFISRFGVSNGVMDVMAGCGFSGRLFQKYLNPSRLLLNDSDNICFRILSENFLHCDIRMDDFRYLLLNNQTSADVVFVDFNSFTILDLCKYWRAFQTIRGKSRSLWLTDSAPYGFRFGNLDIYGCRTPMDYYNMVDQEMRPLGFQLCAVSEFYNQAAALLVFIRDDESFDDVIFLDGGRLTVNRSKKGAFF